MNRQEEYPYAISDRIYKIGSDLGHLAAVKAEGRELPQDGVAAMSLLKELLEIVNGLYGINGKDHRQPSDDESRDSHKQHQPSA